MSFIKNLLKNIIPSKVRTKLRLFPLYFKARLFGVDTAFENMENGDVFNKIYKEGVWGKDFNGDPISGGGSHVDEIIKPYILEVSKFLLKIKPSKIVDLGCGDFNIGKNFVDKCEKYIACDVSSEILNRNKNKFTQLKNVDFNLLDLASDYLPKGDVCFVRAVLQHLSNSDIKNFVNKLNSQKHYKYLVLTEKLPNSNNFKANVDKKTGAHTRKSLNSGVVLHKEPFLLDAKKSFDLLEVKGTDGRIKTIVYEF